MAKTVTVCVGVGVGVRVADVVAAGGASVVVLDALAGG